MTSLPQTFPASIPTPPAPLSLAGTAVAVARSPKHGFAKQGQESLQLIAGEGVAGDAHRGTTVQHLYHLRRDPTKPNLCQVHLFAAEMLAELAEKGFTLTAGELGENILTAGLDLLALPRGAVLRLGAEAEVELTGLRTPCSKLDAHRTGLQQHLWGKPDAKGKRTRRAGVMAVVRVGGEVRAGDRILVELPGEPHIPLGPV